MKFDSDVDAYRPDDGEVAYRMFREGETVEAECGVCGDDIRTVTTDSHLGQEPHGSFWRSTHLGRWVTFEPCGHKVYLSNGQDVAVVVDFPVPA